MQNIKKKINLLINMLTGISWWIYNLSSARLLSQSRLPRGIGTAPSSAVRNVNGGLAHSADQWPTH
jgi:hypothetical protein